MALTHSPYLLYSDGKGNIFEGVAVGQAKGISLAVLNGFRQSLDDAIKYLN